jgi:hypothetical protein
LHANLANRFLVATERDAGEFPMDLSTCRQVSIVV